MKPLTGLLALTVILTAGAPAAQARTDPRRAAPQENTADHLGADYTHLQRTGADFTGEKRTGADYTGLWHTGADFTGALRAAPQRMPTGQAQEAPPPPNQPVPAAPKTKTKEKKAVAPAPF